MSEKYENITGEVFRKDVAKLGLKKAVTRISEDLGIAKSNVSSYLNGKLTPGPKFLEKFYKFYKIEPGSLDLEQAEKPKDKMDEQLKVAPGLNLESLKSELIGHLNTLLWEVRLTRADVRGFVEYQAMKDASNDEEVRVQIMAQINKLVGLNLRASEGKGSPAYTPGNG